MNAEEWQQAKELIAEALLRPRDERSAFLRSACADNRLREEISALIGSASDIDVSSLLGDDVPSENVSGHSAIATPPPVGTIGRYKLGRRLGEGGMGVVYEAEQQRPRRSVALKLIRGGAFASDLAVKLFQREAEALARLKHPDIASIYEAGRTDDGQHFFAMELVSGVPLMDYARALKGTPHSILQQRLDVFCRVGRAVAYAHQRGVIHRDLKPSNILVLSASSNDAGEASTAVDVKILDFGLARVIDADASAASLLTHGVVAGTLPYMSPEQARGNSDEIDIRTDVYALGVILYEMLTGVVPCDVSGKSLPEAARLIAEQAPPPLTRLFVDAQPGGPDDRALRLDRELVTIALKALEKEPSRRYQSVSAFVEDIDRYRRNEPILAYPPSAAYQFRKLISRHKTGFAFVTTSLMLVVLVAAMMAVQSSRTARERDRAVAAEQKARAEAETARRVSEFLVDIFKVSDPSESRGNSITAREVLDRGAARVKAELNDQSIVQATLMDTMGRVFQSLGLFKQARPLLESALASRRQILGNEHGEVATSLTNLGDLLTVSGEYATADQLLQEAVLMRRRLPSGPSNDLSSSLTALGILLRRQGKLAEAEPILREALDFRRNVHGNDHPTVAQSLNHLAMTVSQRGDNETAEKLFLETLDIRRRVFGNQHPDVAATLNNLGMLRRRRGDRDGALMFLRESLAIARNVLGESHPDVTTIRYGLARVLTEKGNYSEAEPLLRSLVDADRRQLGPTHPYVATSLNSLADMLIRAGRASEAERLFREAMQIQRVSFPEDHWEIAQTKSHLGGALVALRRYEDAERLLLEAYRDARKHFDEKHPIVVATVQRIVTLYESAGQSARAAAYRELLPVPAKK